MPQQTVNVFANTESIAQEAARSQVRWLQAAAVRRVFTSWPQPEVEISAEELERLAAAQQWLNERAPLNLPVAPPQQTADTALTKAEGIALEAARIVAALMAEIGDAPTAERLAGVVAQALGRGQMNTERVLRAFACYLQDHGDVVDAVRISRIAAAHDIPLTPMEAAIIWMWHSDTCYAASWMSMDSEPDERIWEAVARFLDHHAPDGPVIP